MKKSAFLFVLMIVLFSKAFSEPDLFSLNSLSDFINIEKNQTYSTCWFITDISDNSRSKVEKITGRLERFIPEYKNELHVFDYDSSALLITELSKVYEESNYSYLYDEKSRLQSCGIFTYKYINENLRECYISGELKKTEQIDYSDNKIKITVTKFSKRYSDNSIIKTGEEIYEYNLVDGIVNEIVRRDINIKGIESQNHKIMQLEYEHNYLKQITESYGGNIQIIQHFEYENGKLVKRTVHFANNSNSDYIAEYSDYDEEGNYTKYKEKSGDRLRLSFSRNIQYRN